MNTNAKIELIIVTNPLDFSNDGHVRYQLDFEAKTLLELLGGDIAEYHAVFLNGEHIPDEQCATTIPAPGDYVCYTPIVAAGGKNEEDRGKFRTVLQAGFAIAAFAIVATNPALWAVATILSVGGNLLTNSIWPPIVDEDGETPNTYGVNGPQNNSKEGSPIPLIYGRHWTGGNLVDVHTVNVTPTKQDLFMLLALGEGEIDGVEKVTIDESDASEISGIEIEHRAGTADQPIIPWFNQIYQSIAKSVTFAHNDTDTLIHTSPPGMDQIRFDLTFSQGLIAYDDDNDKKTTYVDVKFQYRETGATTWLELPMDGNSQAELAEQVQEAQQHYDVMSSYYGVDSNEAVFAQEALTKAQADLAAAGVSTIRYKGKKRETLRYSAFSSMNFDPLLGYEFRMSTTAPRLEDYDYSDDLVLGGVVEILNSKVRYKLTALTGIKIRMGEVINRMPKVLAQVRGIRVRVYDPETKDWSRQWSQNPAWIAYDILTNDRYGPGRPDSKMHLSAFLKWAQFCDDNALKFNGVIDGRKNAWDAVKAVFQTGQAIQLYTGTTISVSIESSKPASMMFNVASIVSGSLGTNWTTVSDRSNEVKVVYYDKDNFNKEAMVTLRDKVFNDPTIDKSRLKVRSTELKLRGVDNRDQAVKAGTLALNMNKLSQTVTFETSVEALACQVGDKILIQHDMPQWSQGGLSAEGSDANTLVLDKEIEISEAIDSVLVKFSSDYLQTFEVTGVNGDIVYLGAFSVATYEQIQRAVSQANGTDYEVEQTWSDGTGQGVVLRDASGVLIGDLLDLFDTDVVETRAIANAPGMTDTLTLTQPFSRVPDEYTPWIAGKQGREAKPFVIRDIGIKNDHFRTVTALEYDETVFDATLITDIQDYSPTPSRIVNVGWNGFTEAPQSVADAVVTILSFSWEVVDPGYKSSEVWVNVNDEGFAYMGQHPKSYSMEVQPSDLVKVKILPIDAYERRPSLGEATLYQHIVAGVKPVAPTAPIDVVATPRDNSVDLVWKPTKREEGSIVARGGQGVFEIWMAPGLATEFTDPSVQLKSTLASTRAFIAGLVAETNYSLWIRELNRLQPDVASDLVKITFQTAGAADFESLFPVGITHSMLSGSLLSDVGNTTLAQSINELSTTVADSLVDEQVLRDFTINTVADQRSEIDGNIATATDQILTLADDQTSIAGRVTTLETTSGQNTTSLNTISEVVDGVKAQHFVSINNNGVFSGFGLMSELNEYDEVTSQFIIAADSFLVSKDGTSAQGATVPVFGVDTESGEVRMINAVIQSEVRSMNFDSGVAGFKLDAATGSVEINNLTARGNITANALTVGAVKADSVETGAITVDKIESGSISQFEKTSTIGTNTAVITFETGSATNESGVIVMVNMTAGGWFRARLQWRRNNGVSWSGWSTVNTREWYSDDYQYQAGGGTIYTYKPSDFVHNFSFGMSLSSGYTQYQFRMLLDDLGASPQFVLDNSPMTIMGIAAMR
jgi:predicted phage tail protein